MKRKRSETPATNLTNIGDWVSAKIYSDDRNGCSCGSKVWSYKEMKELPGLRIPSCACCGQPPRSFVFAATVEGQDGRVKRIKVRHTQDGDRLKDVIDVIFTLKTVRREIQAGTFDVRRYEAPDTRESFKFDNFATTYITHFERSKQRGETSPAGLKDKKTLIKNHLLPYFKGVDIANINDLLIKKFFDSYTDRLRTRNKASAELKTMLYWAMNQKMLKFIPTFPEIPASKMIGADKFISKEKQELIISKIIHPTYRAAISTLKIYGLRPCEVRSLKWEDINFQERVFYIRSHISLNEDIPGRKSQTSIVHELPLVDDFQLILEAIPRSINSKDYVFRGSHGRAIGGNVLARAWNEACKLAKVKDVKLYVGTKHSTLSRLGREYSDSQLIKLSGHTNTKTIRRYNQATLKDIREMIQRS